MEICVEQLAQGSRTVTSDNNQIKKDKILIRIEHVIEFAR